MTRISRTLAARSSPAVVLVARAGTAIRGAQPEARHGRMSVSLCRSATVAAMNHDLRAGGGPR